MLTRSPARSRVRSSVTSCVRSRAHPRGRAPNRSLDPSITPSPDHPFVRSLPDLPHGRTVARSPVRSRARSRVRSLIRSIARSFVRPIARSFALYRWRQKMGSHHKSSFVHAFAILSTSLAEKDCVHSPAKMESRSRRVNKNIHELIRTGSFPRNQCCVCVQRAHLPHIQECEFNTKTY